MSEPRPVRFPRVRRVVLFFATHYTGAFLFVMGVTLVSTGFSISYLASLESNLNSVYEYDVKGGDAVETAFVALLTLESSVKDLVLYPDRRSRVRTEAAIQSQTETLRSALSRAAPRFHTPKARQAMLATQGDLKDYLAVLDAKVQASEKKPLTAADLGSLDAVSNIVEKDFGLLLANRSANSNIGISELVFQLRFSLVVTIVIVVVTLGVRFWLWLAGHPDRQGRRKDD